MRQRILALGLLAGVSFALAAAPVVIEQNGDLYLKQASGLRRLTNHGKNFSPVVSPDGKWVVYVSVPDHVNVAWPNETPANIWLMNLTSFKATRIADQTWPAENGRRRTLEVTRSIPAWTPDSRMLMWTEMDLNACYGKDTVPLGMFARFDVTTGRLVQSPATTAMADDCWLETAKDGFEVLGVNFGNSRIVG